MSTPSTSPALPPFSPAATPASLDGSNDAYPAAYIISTMLEISGYLVGLGEQSTMFGPQGNDPYTPSLQTLYARIQQGRPCPSLVKGGGGKYGDMIHNDNDHNQNHANEPSHTHTNPPTPAAHRPLDDFQDLYYATLAHMHFIHHHLSLRLTSLFATPSTPLYVHGPSIAALHASLAQYWTLLNSAPFVRGLDGAVRRARAAAVRREIVAALGAGRIEGGDAAGLLGDLDKAEERVAGVVWIGAWAPSMVAAWLGEKYRGLLEGERKVVEREEREERMRRKRGRVVRKGGLVRHGRAARQMRAEAEMGAQSEMKGPLHTRVRPTPEQSVEDQVQDALEWQMKTRRVEEYTEYLRGMASRDARYVVQSTALNTESRTGGFSGQGQREDTEMMGLRF
ncbi:hypothetical protein EJ07DRAFT_170741 [Lizonia empirigonia]|nr:hypothetical protein EJ07DRAFT_170741 [Lizonia empirigonia]